MRTYYTILSPEAVGHFAEEAVSFHAGQAFWLPKGYTHTLHIAPGHDHLTIYHLRFTNPQPNSTALTSRTATALHSDIAALHRDYQGNHPLRSNRLQHRLFLILSQFRELHDSTHSGLSPLQREKIHQLLDRLPPHERLQPADLAAEVDLSPDWFTRLFTASYGIAPRSWLKRQRLEQAAIRLAESQDSISAIAREFGYDEIFRFSKQFKEVHGQSPRSWRQQQSGIQRLNQSLM